LDPQRRLIAGCGGFLLGGVLGGFATLTALYAAYNGHPHQDSGSIGDAIGAGIAVIAVAGLGFLGGGIAGAAGLLWLSGRNRSRMAAGVLSWIGILGAAGLLVASGIWWMNAQATGRRDVIKARERHALEQVRRDEQDPAGRVTPPPNQQQASPAAVPGAPPPAVTPLPLARTAEPGSQSRASVTVMHTYGELAYPSVTETRIALPSPRPNVPEAAVIQFTNDPIGVVIAYYEPKLQTIRKSPNEYLGSGPRSSDGLRTFVHIRPGSNNDVYVELTAG